MHTCVLCEIAGIKGRESKTNRRRAFKHDMGGILRRANRDLGIGADEYCSVCEAKVQLMPVHRGCEYAGDVRMPFGYKRCSGCTRLVSLEEWRELAAQRAVRAEVANG